MSSEETTVHSCKRLIFPVKTGAFALFGMAITCPLQAAGTSHSKHHTTHHSVPQSTKHATTPSSSSMSALQAARNREAALRAATAEEAAKLSQAQRQKESAAAKASEDHSHAVALSSATVAAAAALQNTELRQEELLAQVDDLQARQQEASMDLMADAHALAPLLPVAQRLSLYPMDVLLTTSAPTEDVVRGLLVVRGMAGTLEQRAEDLRARQKDLTNINALLSSRMDELASLEKSQSLQRAELVKQANAARDAQIQSNMAAKQASANVAQESARQRALQAELNGVLAAEAAAMEQLRREAEMAERAARKAREAAEAQRRVQAAAARSAGRVTKQQDVAPPPSLPVSGRGGDGIVTGHLLTTWGQSTDTGTASGNTYAASSGSGVRAPCAGTVEFASPFRSYGQMLILNCGRGYRFVLAGLGNLNVAPGQSLAKGAAVGSMPAGGGNLLVQLRNGTRSVNPRQLL
ncbi:murein hydrolase activator EnvC family protein [Acetobacter sp.]|uniref:murein hydrolase activator EnvC family protein n=1 Tax=Acetobacter sp. TaxID=440 RepID=UPI0039E82D55